MEIQYYQVVVITIPMLLLSFSIFTLPKLLIFMLLLLLSLNMFSIFTSSLLFSFSIFSIFTMPLLFSVGIHTLAIVFFSHIHALVVVFFQQSCSPCCFLSSSQHNTYNNALKVSSCMYLAYLC